MAFRPDLVHVNPGLDATSRRALRRDAVNVWLASIFFRQVVVFWRGWDLSWCGNRDFPGGNNGWMCRIYKKAAAQVVLASHFKEDLRRWGFAMPIYIETTVASAECLEDGETLAKDVDTVNLLFLSRIEIAKGVCELLEAFRLLRGRSLQYRMTIAGDGPDLEMLKGRARELGLEDVIFPGYVRGKEKVACYRSASIFCFPTSHGEGMPNAVLEAMATGLPVVASDVGGLKDILEDGKTGATLTLREGKPGNRFDPEEIANVIERLANDLELRERIKNHNAAYARRRFAAPLVARRLEEIYKSVLFRGKDSVGYFQCNRGTIDRSAKLAKSDLIE